MSASVAAETAMPRAGLAIWPLRMTIRRKLLAGCVALACITGCLGALGAYSVGVTGALVVETFDRSLMSVSYARAAAAEFNAMVGLVSAYRVAATAEEKRSIATEARDHARSLYESLGVVEDRTLSDVGRRTARAVAMEVATWELARTPLLNARWDRAAGTRFERLSEQVSEQLDVLVNHAAGDGFRHRQRALQAIQTSTWLGVAATSAALVLSAGLALLIARRITQPLKAASDAAGRIAAGDLVTPIPAGGSDEFGQLLSAMSAMRGRIRSSMDRAEAKRRSAQRYLDQAVEGSEEGVVLLDDDGRIVVANTQATRFFRWAGDLLRAGVAFDQVAAAIGEPCLLEGMVPSTVAERQLPDGRWLRASRSGSSASGSVLIWTDVTDLKEQRAAAERLSLRLDVALSNMSQGLCLFDGENRLRVVNRRFCEIYGIEPGGLTYGMPYRKFLHRIAGAIGYQPEAVEGLYEARLRFLARRSPDVSLRELADGRVVAVSHQPMEDGGWIATHEDMTEIRRITFMARHDVLTSLANRAALEGHLQQSVALLGRGTGFAVHCLDMDRFKGVNDTLGHAVGDGLLRQVADRLSACVRETDLAARLGGDEFVVVQSNVAGPETAAELAQRIVAVLNQPYEVDGHRISTGVSVGVAVAPADGSCADHLLRKADSALYAAKSGGRSTYRMFDGSAEAQDPSDREDQAAGLAPAG